MVSAESGSFSESLTAWAKEFIVDVDEVAVVVIPINQLGLRHASKPPVLFGSKLPRSHFQELLCEMRTQEHRLLLESEAVPVASQGSGFGDRG